MSPAEEANKIDRAVANADRLARIETKLDAVLEQTIKTNGRVTKLEAWRNYILGGGSLVTFCVGVLAVYAKWS